MKKLFFISLVIVLLVTMASCQKDQDTIPSVSQNEAVKPDPGDSGDMHLKIASSTILNATNASQIPSQMFAVNPIYKTYYTHIKQYAGECSWTSYVICISTIVAANHNFCYYTPISTVKSRCTAHATAVGISPLRIDNLSWYAGAYDGSYINRSLVSRGTKFQAIREMLAHINNYHTPFVVLSSINSIGHYRVIFSIDWKKGETGSTVYYTDCNYPTGAQPGIVSNYGFNANVKSMDLSQFMATMTGSFATYYNMLFMWSR